MLSMQFKCMTAYVRVELALRPVLRGKQARRLFPTYSPTLKFPTSSNPKTPPQQSIQLAYLPQKYL